jgi:ArsR family transcriptional regulator
MHAAESAEILRSVAHPVRLAILASLVEHSQCVKELNAHVAISQARFSQHMASLRAAGLVDSHVHGSQRCYYLLRPKLVRKLIRLLKEDHPIQWRSRASVVGEVQRWRRVQGLEPCGRSAKS